MAGTGTTTTTNVKLKLLVDKKTERVVFAEAGKDFVDFLLTLFRLPLATVVRLLSGDSFAMVSSLPELYRSIETLDDSFLNPNITKSNILFPGTGPTTPSAAVRRLLPGNIFSSRENTFYKCTYSSCHRQISDSYGAKCVECGHTMTDSLKLAPSEKAKADGEDGYVKNTVTYMVMDDLSVRPATMISTIEVLNAANVKEFAALDSIDVELGIDEVIENEMQSFDMF